MRQVRVLLVEDNPHVADLVTDGLEGAARRTLKGRVSFDFEVRTDGQAGLARLRESPPDLIILDVYMPIMDGAQLLRHLRATDAGSVLPVIALSAGGLGAREAALEAGANVFFDKPIRLAEVFAAVVDLLKLADEPAPA